MHTFLGRVYTWESSVWWEMIIAFGSLGQSRPVVSNMAALELDSQSISLAWILLECTPSLRARGH